MQVKTFTGANNKEVLDMIKADLGSEAVILDTRTSSVGGTKMVTMTAALERDDIAPGGRESADGAGRGLPGESAPLPRYFLDEWDSIKKHLFALMKPALNLEKLGPGQRAALEYLQREGAGDQALLELYRRLSKAPGEPALAQLSAMLPVKPWGIEHWPQRVHLVAGPYGAGKTTTAVRLALAYEKSRSNLAALAQREGRRLEGGNGKVCIVNADTERGGGRLLLKHYAGLSDFAYREAGNAMEMRGVLSEITAQGFERVIVDLPGLSSGAYLRDLAAGLGLYNGNSAIKTALHLVLPPGHDDALTLTLLERYHLDLPGSLIWSKLDEYGRYGALLNVALASGLPVSALSFGSGILNTLLPASQGLLWRLIFKHELPLHAAPAARSGRNGRSGAGDYGRSDGGRPGDDL